MPTSSTTLNPIFEGEGTKILFQSQIQKSFQGEHFQLKSYFDLKMKIQYLSKVLKGNTIQSLIFTHLSLPHIRLVSSI